MDHKKLALIIVFFSIVSGFIGSYFMIEILGKMPEISSNVENISQKIVKDVSIKNINITDLQSQVTKIAKDISPSVVSIIIKKDLIIYRSDPWGFFETPIGKQKKQVGGGSGFFIRKDGTILTNKHVIIDENADYKVITSDGREFDAKVISKDPLTDLAVIKIIPNFPSDLDKIKPLEFLDEKNTPNIGEFVLAIGNALAEFQNTVTFGIISGKGRTIEAGGIEGGSTEKLSGLLQTDAAINPGNSGGPLVNLDGKVIAINTAIAGNSQNLGFAIPLSIQKVNYILNSIDKYGKIKRAFAGIFYIPLNPDLSKDLGLSLDVGNYIPNKKGAIISGSNAEKAGLKPGDIIIEADSIKLDGKINLSDIVQNKIPGDKIRLKIYRNGEYKTIDLELGEY